MTDRIEITDAMVERACQWLARNHTFDNSNRMAQQMLEAALNPEPEVDVTDGMILQGLLTYENSEKHLVVDNLRASALVDIYRAMRKLEPKAKEGPMDAREKTDPPCEHDWITFVPGAKECGKCGVVHRWTPEKGWQP